MGGREASDVSFLAVSDIHLSLKPPLARSAEPDWIKAQARVLKQLDSLASFYGCPVVIAGDVFDRYNPPPEVVNLAMRELTAGRYYAVPGQHDLPNHRYRDVHRSAYWTLVQSGKVTNLPPSHTVEDGHLRFFGFPWGADFVEKPYPDHDLYQDVAVVHRYLWVKGKGHPRARDEDRLKHSLAALKTYDVGVFGDNHTPFVWAKEPGPTVINSGCLIPRKADERGHRPCVWAVYGDNSYKAEYLDTSEDKWLEPEELVESLGDEKLKDFVKSLTELQDAAVNFAEVLEAVIASRGLTPGAREILVNALQGVSEK